MKYYLGCLVLAFFVVTPVAAYELVLTEVTRPYDVVAVEGDVSQKHVYLGELENFPIMYEVTTEDPLVFDARLRQLYTAEEPLPLSLIVIRQNDNGGGVTEVARQQSTPEDWTFVKDSVMGMSFWESKLLSETVEPGVYRIEVSTPENLGRYMLTIGNEQDGPGYFSALGSIRTTQKFFGYSVFHLFASSYVYYHLGVVILLALIYITWKHRSKIAHVA